jgi:predicted hotdog family 3-hydroxylacyl-ACP dehydratase
MCLLESVESWDANRIVCRAVSHRALDNPLRRAGCLPALCGVEYGLQAMAAHGTLAGRPSRRAGLLASLRKTRLHVERLDDISDALVVEARRMSDDLRLLVYEFAVSAGGRLLIEGRAIVIEPPGTD